MDANSTEDCGIEISINNEIYVYYMLIPATFSVFLFGFTVKRRRLWPTILHGRPGIPIPVKFLNEQENRLPYVIAFCTCGMTMLGLIVNESSLKWQNGTPPYTKIFVTFTICVLYAIEYWPIFATIAADHLIGYIWGTFYVWQATVVTFINLQPCWADKDRMWFETAAFMPMYAGLLYLSLAFPYRFFMKVKKYFTKDNQPQNKNLTSTSNLFQIEHVRALFERGKRNEKKTEENLLQRFLYKIYRPVPSFRYSLSTLTGTALATVVTYIVTVNILDVTHQFQKSMEIQFSRIRDAENQTEKLRDFFEHYLGYNVSKDDITHIIDESHFWTHLLEASIYVGILISFLIICVSMLHTLRSYQQHLLNMYRGIYKGIPRRRNDDPETTLITACKFIGYQAAHALWGFMICAILLNLGFFVVFALFTVIIRYEIHAVESWLLQYMLPIIAIVLVIQIVQQNVIKMVFLQRGTNGKHCLGIDNRRLFYNYQFVMAFFNTALGFFSSIMRILKAMLFGVWLIPKLDMSTLSRKFERFDAGFLAYVSMLKLENTHTNPVLVVFTSLLLDSLQEPTNSVSSTNSGPKFVLLKQELSKRKQLRNRWALAVTLNNNPWLRLMRHQEAAKINTTKNGAAVVKF